MPCYSISEIDKNKIAEVVKQFMYENGIQGEVTFEFTDDYTPDIPLEVTLEFTDDYTPGIQPKEFTQCCTKFINGRWVSQCPCSS